MYDPDDKDPLMSRRSFLALMGVGACLVGAGTTVGVIHVRIFISQCNENPTQRFFDRTARRSAISAKESILSKAKSFY